MTRRRLSLNRHPSVSIKPPSIIRRYASASKAWDVIATWSNQHLNFYRVHMLVFILVPFTASGIFYASNGDTQVAYIDCLFMCVSAMTVTVRYLSCSPRGPLSGAHDFLTLQLQGLNTVVLSILTRWQQVMLYVRWQPSRLCVDTTRSTESPHMQFLMVMGSMPTVSIVLIAIRRCVPHHMAVTLCAHPCYAQALLQTQARPCR